MKPFVKWAGGKRQIIDFILQNIATFAKVTDNNYTFFEPFAGGGAVFLALKHHKIVINDSNNELMNCYQMIKENPYELMKELDIHWNNYRGGNPQYYYEIRNWDREGHYQQKTNIERAARIIFLNKTCYNGLYRVNQKGQFNTPAGRYANPTIYEEKNIIALHRYFNKIDAIFMSGDYSEVLHRVNRGDIVYIDPPYDYGEDDGFTGYQKEGFKFSDFIRMKQNLDICIQREAFVIISNNATERVIDLFAEDPRYKVLYHMERLNTKRSINSNGSLRNNGKEVIIMGIPITFPQADSLSKIIKVIKSKNPDILKNLDDLKKALDVNSNRQVHYYLMALRYLGLINHNKEFSQAAIKLRLNKSKNFNVEFAHIILQKELFHDVYNIEQNSNVFLTDNEIADFIKSRVNGYSESTYRRRARTVKKWLEWCKSVLND